MISARRYYFDVYTLLADDNDYYIESANNDTLTSFISVYGMPEYDLGPTIGMETVDTILDAGAGYVSYDWESGDSTTQTYHVTTPGIYNLIIENIHGCIKEDSVKVLQSSEDLGVIELVSPQSDCEFTPDTVVRVKVKNFRGATYGIGDTIVVGYQLNGSSTVVDSIFLATPVLAQDTFEYEFANPIDMSTFMDYEFTFFTILEGDLDYDNDTLHSTISAWGYPDVEIGPDTLRTSQADTIIFDAGPGFASYIWQDATTNQTLTPPNRRSKEYMVTVTDVYGCGADTDSVQIIAYDLSVSTVINPENSCEQLNNEIVTIRIRNNGQDTIRSGSQIPVSYIFEGNPAINETITLATDLNPISTRNYSFTPTVDMSTVNDYDFTFTCSFKNDINSVNDTLNTTISNWGYPTVDLGPDTIFTDQPDTVLLIADPGYTLYNWSTGGTNDTLAVPNNNSAWYSVTVYNQYGCSTRDSVYIFALDIGIIDMPAPVSACVSTSSEDIRASIWNYGTTAIPSGTQIPVHYRINNGSVVSENYTLPTQINPGSSISYTFTSTADLSVPDNYKIDVFTTFLNDVDLSNDTLTSYVNVYGNPIVNLPFDTIHTTQPDSIVLDAGSHTTYSWNTGSSNRTISVSALSSYWYKVTVGSAYACTSSDSTFVNVTDIGVSDVTGPVSDCELAMAENISVTITNYSQDTLITGQNINVSYTLNGGSSVTETYTLLSDLLPSASTGYTFTAQESFTGIGIYEVVAYTSYNRDVESSNNSIIETIEVYGYPNIDLGPDTIVRSLNLTLDAGGPYNGYLWQDGSTNQTYLADTTGTYFVTVGDAYGCGDSDTIDVILLTPDISISDLLTPSSRCYTNGVVNPVVRMQNTGTDTISAGEEVTISYLINGGSVDQEIFTIGSQLLPGDSVDLTFTNTLDVLQYTSHAFEFITDFSRDLKENNDTLLLTRYIYPYPAPFLGNDTTIRSKQFILDPGYDENYSYVWQDATTDSIYNVVFDGGLFDIFTVTVSDKRMSNCSTQDEISIQFRITDAELTDITIPTPVCENDQLNVTINLNNVGNQPISTSQQFYLGYLNEDMEVSEVPFNLSAELVAETNVNLVVNNTVFTHGGTQNVDVYIRMNEDADATNDTLTRSITTSAAPVSTMGGANDTLTTDLPVTLQPLQGQSDYIWNDGSTRTSTYSTNAQGWYWVDITGSNGCVARDSVYVSSLTSIIPISELDEILYIYPNPAVDIIKIISNTELKEDYNFVICNSDGKTIKEGLLLKNEIADHVVNISNLPSGIYFIRIYNSNNIYIRKLIFTNNY